MTSRAQTFSQTRSAADEFGSRAVPRVHQVVLVEEALDLDAEVVETLLDFRIELCELERDRVTIRVLADEGDVDDANRARVDEVGERGCDLAFELVARKRDDHVVDRADLIAIRISFRFLCSS